MFFRDLLLTHLILSDKVNLCIQTQSGKLFWFINVLAGLYANADLAWKESGENAFNYRRDVFRKHSVFTGLLHWIWKPGDILFSPQVTEHFSDITSLQKEMCFTVSDVQSRIPSLFSLRFPIAFIWLDFFYMKAAFCGKMMAHISVQASSFFQFCSQWLYHQLHCEQDWPGVVSLFQQGQCWLFLVPIACYRDVSKTKPVVKILLNRVLAITIWHYFWQGACIKCFIRIALGTLEQPCRRKRFFGRFQKLWCWRLPFPAQLQWAFHGAAEWAAWSQICALVPSGGWITKPPQGKSCISAAPIVPVLGIKETLRSHLLSQGFPIDIPIECKVLAQQGLSHRSKTWDPCFYPLAPKRVTAVVQEYIQEHGVLPRGRWGRQKHGLHGLWIWRHWACTWYVCVWSSLFPFSSSQFSFINDSTGLIFTQTPLRSAVWSSTHEVPSLGVCRLHAWNMVHCGGLENYPAGVSKSQSPITGAFTIVALRLPIKLLVATSGFVKALKSKSWGLNLSIAL